MKTTVAPFEKKFGVKVDLRRRRHGLRGLRQDPASRGDAGLRRGSRADAARDHPRPEGEAARADHREGGAEPQARVGEEPRPSFPTPASCTPTSTRRSSGTRRESRSRIPGPTTGSRRKKYGDKVKGQVINFNPANLLSIYALIMAAKLKGGDVANLDPAWELLKAQKPYVGTVVTTSAQAAPYFENEQVWIAPYWSARADITRRPAIRSASSSRRRERSGSPIAPASPSVPRTRSWPSNS